MSRAQEPSALEIAAEQMRLLLTMEPNKQKVSLNQSPHLFLKPYFYF